ncbi:MAG: substrate-binding domain-containing protein, partial [Chthoniobacteraceae bacterium]
VKEGLIERLPRRGTFVRGRMTQIASAAVYFGGDLWYPDNLFYQHIYHDLRELFSMRSGRSILLVDERLDQNKTVSVLPELQKLVDQREVQGVIALMLLKSQVDWLEKLQVPVAAFGTSGMHMDFVETFDLALARFALDGCRTVAFIGPRMGRVWWTMFKKIAKSHRLETDHAWIPSNPYYDISLEEAGYRQFKDLWSNSKHPDGLLVYPDVACRGMMVAALELGLKVPRDLRVIFHRNAGIDYLCPWSIPHIVTDTKEVARLLAEHLDAQFLHGPTPAPIVGVKLVDPPCPARGAQH